MIENMCKRTPISFREQSNNDIKYIIQITMRFLLCIFALHDGYSTASLSSYVREKKIDDGGAIVSTTRH